MPSIDERYMSLAKFPPQPIIETIDEDIGVEFILTFHPMLNIMTITRSDDEGEPSIAISYNSFVKNCNNLFLNNNNILDSCIKRVMREWKSAKKEIKTAFFDRVPLNSMYIGRQYI